MSTLTDKTRRVALRSDLKKLPTNCETSPAVTSGDRCRCGSTEFVDVVLTHFPHNGNSTRRDCAVCEHFHSFPEWYGNRAEGQA